MINSKGFSIKDQLHFAKISGDNNPLHIDVTEVRRMLVGGPVVHGIHLLFWSLEWRYRYALKGTSTFVQSLTQRSQSLDPTHMPLL